MSRNNLAVIDIGSHSVRLLMIRDGMEYRDQIITRLGEGAGAGLITSEAMERTFAAVEAFALQADGLDAYAFSTSAVRDAENRDTFLGWIWQKLGVKVDVLSGGEEARLAYAGASAGTEGKALGVVDIGGGSTEIVTGRDGAVVSAQSFDVGAVRLTGTGKTAREMTDYARGLIALDENAVRPEAWRGIGGTITTLAAMEQELVPYDPDKVRDYPLTLEAVRTWVERLDSMPVEERMRLPGIQPERGKVILAGVCVLRGVMEKLSIHVIRACVSDNLEGYIRMLNNEKT